MITIINDTVKVKFGEAGIGAIAVDAVRFKLRLKTLKAPYKIGVLKERINVNELPEVLLEFSDPKSIDVLIEHLHWIKTQMEIERSPLAC